jgi:DNA-binding PadR family transcriptional regulator
MTLFKRATRSRPHLGLDKLSRIPIYRSATMKDNLKEFLPLSPATFYILLALSDEDRHGYGIMQEVARQSEGRYKLGPGTFYDNLEKLIDHGVVKEVPRKSANDDPRRRYYRMTGFGRTLFLAEVSRLDSVVREAKVRLRSAKPKEAL